MSDDYKDHLFGLFLAGGGGTRLWPKSRDKDPKQFLPLFNHKTLTQITANRFKKILPWEKIYCVTVSEKYKEEVLREVPQFLPENVIVEPARRETGPAHGLGAAYIYQRDSEAVIITESADRLVRPVSLYLKTLQGAAKIAYERKVMVAMGVKPRYPNPGYGHIKRGEKKEIINGIKFYPLEKYVEKPELAMAKKYTASGKYYWNAGQFVWRADTLLASLRKNAPEVGKAIDEISEAIGSSDEKSIIARKYKSMPKVAIDYAVAEKDKNFLAVVGEFFWTDIGDWKEVWENLPHDNMGNVIIDGDEPGGEIINIDTSDALIHKDGRLIAVVDVDNIVIVDTKDALLVVSKSRAQSVKKVVNYLKEKKKQEYL